MKIKDRAALRWLRVCHMLTAPLWFGSAVNALIDGGTALILPMALLTVVIGLLYGACTPWGFFRFRWVTAKWVLTLLALSLAVLDALWSAAPEGIILAQAALLAASVVVAVLKPGGRKVVPFARPRKERTDEELRESIERDRRPL